MFRYGWSHFKHWHIEQRWIMSRFNKKAIRPGDLYENCNYQPMVCIRNDYGDLTGISLINGVVGCCSAFHCGPVKFTAEEAVAAIAKYKEEAGASSS